MTRVSNFLTTAFGDSLTPRPMNITEEQVIQWMHQQREMHGLSALQIVVFAGIAPKENIHNGVPEHSTIYAHRETICQSANTITEAVSKLTQ